MSTANIRSANVMLPSEQERKQIFRWLKQISSYTAWNRIFSFYQAWADATEASVRLASERGLEKRSSIHEQDFVLNLKGLAHFEEGLQRLRHGDKRVFKYDATGAFVMAGRPVEHWCMGIWGRGEIGIDYEHTPNWTTFEQALINLNVSWGECSGIIESEWIGDSSRYAYGVWLRENLQKMHFPIELPEVPSSADNTLVPTGRTIPCSGIWEPVDAPKTKGFSLFRDREPPKGPLSTVGCMNYLHGGSPAPKASLETEDDNPETDAVWRLLWRDDRYEDGTIPTEEADYLFLEPERSRHRYQREQEEQEPASHIAVIARFGGDIAPKSGRWALSTDHLVSVTVTEGDLLPKTDHPEACWIWSE